jgi:winged helix DNA-binding protein
MSIPDIARERLLRQRILGTGLESPADVVRWMGAVQAQDFAAAKWAVGLRTRACTDGDVEAAFTNGKILRTHVMRPTWHFIAPEDLGWMQALTAQRVNAMCAYQYRQLELDAVVFRRTNAVLTKALRGGIQLTRLELGGALRNAGIRAAGLRLTYIVLRAELDALICSGARRGKQFTYALVDERAPRPRTLSREEALAELTRRYFTSHGPATLQDFSWWSGLSASDVRAGTQSVRAMLNEHIIDGQSYLSIDSSPAARRPKLDTHLLTNFDEYIVGYTDRSAIFDEAHAANLDARHNPLFQHTIVCDGRISGTWKRTLHKESVEIKTLPFVPPTKSGALALAKAVRRYSEFLGLELKSL